MALPTQVRPGDVISSDLMNAILEQIALLGGTASGGSQVVPNVFGMFLTDARAVVLQPTRQLSLGFTFDVNGAAVDPLVPANQNLIVLNQSPVADTRVAPNTPVNLVVSASTGGSGPAPVPAPTITGTQTPGSVPATSFAVGTTMVIVGTNFSPNASQNTVRFNNVPATSVVPDSGDPTRRLLVVVPPGIPGLPNVTVSVSVTGNAAAPTTAITVTAASPTQHTISSVSPGLQTETLTITISGTNFTAAAQVFIRDVLATSTFVNSTTITAVVPNFPGVATSAIVGGPIRIAISGNPEATFPIGFSVRGA